MGISYIRQKFPLVHGMIMYVGWCYVSLSATSPDVKVSAVAALILGYELWTWLAFALIIVFSVCYVAVFKYRKNRGDYTKVVSATSSSLNTVRKLIS